MTLESRRARRFFLPAIVIASVSLPIVAAADTTVVISEYGGCRMTGTTGLNACTGTSTSGNDEFVELYNATSSAVDISGWSIQRRSAGGTASCFAVVPLATSIAAHGFYLVAGSGYDATHYSAVAADFISSGTAITGGPESLVLFSTSACTGTTDVVDSVSVGSITDTFTGLRLPPVPVASIANGLTVERKACASSTASNDISTGMLSGGGHEFQGNGQSSGASDADWIVRPAPGPQNSLSSLEIPAPACFPPPVPLIPDRAVWALGLLVLVTGALALSGNRSPQAR